MDFLYIMIGVLGFAAGICATKVLYDTSPMFRTYIHTNASRELSKTISYLTISFDIACSYLAELDKTQTKEQIAKYITETTVNMVNKNNIK